MQYWVQFTWTSCIVHNAVPSTVRLNHSCMYIHCCTEYSSLEPVMYIVHCAVLSTIRLNQLCTLCTVQYRVQFTWTSYVHCTLCSTEYNTVELVMYIVHCAVPSTIRLNQLCAWCTVQYRVQFTWTSYIIYVCTLRNYFILCFPCGIFEFVIMDFCTVSFKFIFLWFF